MERLASEAEEKNCTIVKKTESFYDLLINEYRSRTGELRDQRKALKEELLTVEPSKEELEKHNLTLSVLARRAEDSIVDNNPEDADKFNAQIEELSKDWEDRLLSAKETRILLEGKNVEIDRIAKKVLHDIFPEIQDVIRGRLAELLDLIDSAWAGLQHFERVAPINLSSYLHCQGLRLRPLSTRGSKALRKHLDQWL